MKLTFSVFLILISFSAFAKTLKIMQLNAENFFDTSFDHDTEDYTYLPLELKRSFPGHSQKCARLGSEFYRNQCLFLDWNEKKFSKKIDALSRVIRSFDNFGTGPDILVLQEIENIRVLEKIIRDGLPNLGYRYRVLIEGDDTRGIDVAIVSKLPIKSARIHPLVMNGQRLNTRGILEATIELEGKRIVVFANHWPSQGNPSIQRVESARLLSHLAGQKYADLIVAVGDFNTVLNEVPYPFDFIEDFIDTETIARSINPLLNPGTHFYRGHWSSLDKIFVHKNSTFFPDYRSFKILTPPFMMKRDQGTGHLIPYRFNHETGEGYTDHLPVALNFIY